jgi:DNA modification methylase
MPESVRDRCTKAHEYLFMLTKRARYYYDADAVKEPASEGSGWAKSRARGVDTWKYGRAAGGDPNSSNGIGGTPGDPTTRNKRSVWAIATRPYPGAHFAVMPPDLIEPCIRAGSRIGDTVLDPFSGAGTVGMVARRLQRSYIGVELNGEYADLSRSRIEGDAPLFNRASARGDQ